MHIIAYFIIITVVVVLYCSSTACVVVLFCFYFCRWVEMLEEIPSFLYPGLVRGCQHHKPVIYCSTFNVHETDKVAAIIACTCR